jgi:hypothetical protein
MLSGVVCNSGSLVRQSVRTAEFVVYPLCGLLGLAGWAVYLQMLRPAPGLDWMVYYTAAQMWLHGDLATVLDPHRFTAALNGIFAGWLSDPLQLHPWVYPPHFLLLFLPFGLLPPLASYIAFVVTTLLGLLLALRLWLGRGGGFWLYAASLVLSPAAALAVCVGQNAFLATALLVGGVALLDSGPLLAGVLFGLLSFKPQLCLMIPVALLAGRRWTTLASAIATGIVVCLASAAVFGVDVWRGWFALMSGHSDFYNEWQLEGRLWGMSVYARAVELGASANVARFGQCLGVLIAAAGVWLAFRRKRPADDRMAILLTATFLAAPHTSNYDAVMLTVAATMLFRRAIAPPAHAIGVSVATLVWLCPIANPPILHPLGAFTPLLTGAFLGVLLLTGLGFRRDRPAHAPLADQFAGS